MRHYLAKMLPGPILTVSTRVSRYQVQSKTSLHLTSHLTWLLALSPRAWHLPFRPETEYAVFRVVGGKTLFPLNPLPTPGNPDFSRSGKTAAEFAQEPSQFARMAPGPSRRRGRPAPPTPRMAHCRSSFLALCECVATWLAKCQGQGARGCGDRCQVHVCM